MRRYRVSRTKREPILRMIEAALVAGGAEILEPANPELAPFLMTIKTPQGERLRLVLYAFLANKYKQRNRPADEHRFQIKYGSGSKEYHEIYVADGVAEVTLMLGVHIERGLFVAVDPAMHAVTRFFRSVEFKSMHLDEADRTGWYSWERDRSTGRRHAEMPRDDLREEALLAFRPEFFLRYVAFERFAGGLDTGERVRLAEKVGRGTPMPTAKHPLEIELGLDASEILDMIGGAFRLKAAVRGSAAERHLGDYLKSLPDLSRVRSIDEDGQPDFEVRFGGSDYRIECKNVLRRTTASGACRVDFQKTRASQSDPCSRYYKPEQFELLAACLHPVTERWEFRFVSTASLPPHAKCVGHLSNRVVVEGEGWSESPVPLLHAR